MSDILTKLAAVLESRKHADADSSYVASLYQGGTDKILKKLGEEATETVIAGKAVTNKKSFMRRQIFGFIAWYC